MSRNRQTAHYPGVLGALLAILLLGGCALPAPTAGNLDATAPGTTPAVDYDAALPMLTAVELAANERLQVVASTNIVADIVAQIGGDRIDLVPLLPVGADPHSFTPTPQDLITLNEADVIFINGLHLEEALLPVFTSLDNPAPVVAVNVGVATMEFGAAAHAHEEETADEAAGEGHDHQHEGADPHTWFSIHAVEQWVVNIEQVLSTLDPTNAETYATNAAAYGAELTALESELAGLIAELPVERRKLVTDHDDLGYFAAAYDFTVVGAVIPSVSTMAAAAAGELAALQDQIEAAGVAAIFVGNTVSPDLADQLAADTGVTVVPIYSDSLSDAEGRAATYLDFMRYNVTTIVNALK